MIASVPSATLLGVDGFPVVVEAHVSDGLPGFHVVGLPDAACRESRDRVRAALLSSRLPWPLRRVTINLAPSGMRKGGAGLDLPIAVALLAAAGELPVEAIEGMAFIGELGLDGSVRRVPGIVSLVDAIAAPVVVVPKACGHEAAVVGHHDVRGVESLAGLVAALRGEEPWPGPQPPPHVADEGPGPDLAEVRGQPLGRRALEVAAAGGHHLLFTGPPGTGRTVLARRLRRLLPPLTGTEALEVTRVHSAAGLPLPPGGLVERPPFRAPHYSASAVSLLGGGTVLMRPGEVSLAHGGVLYLDELGEFRSDTLEMLRQPLEEGVVRVARARTTVTFPARFLLVAAMTCRCGRAALRGTCPCNETTSARRRRVPGPLLDRFDLRVTLVRPATRELGESRAEESAAVAERVSSVRARAQERGFRCNAELPASRLDELAPLSPAAWTVLDYRVRSGTLTAGGLHRVRRVARTVADLDDSEVIDEQHLRSVLELRTEGGSPRD